MKSFLNGIIRDTRKRRCLFALGILLLILCVVFEHHMESFFHSQCDYVLLNTSMRDPQRVRDDCKKLIQSHDSLRLQKLGMRIFLAKEDLPESLLRIGAQKAIVTSNGVMICLRYDEAWGEAWGFMYTAQRPDPGGNGPDFVRETWYRDFYEFRIVEG